MANLQPIFIEKRLLVVYNFKSFRTETFKFCLIPYYFVVTVYAVVLPNLMKLIYLKVFVEKQPLP